jgi:hypothetical protein
MASGDGYRAFAALDPIQSRLGPAEFGRICQILLAFSFLELRYEVPIMQLSGRPDIVARKGTIGYAIEAKAQLGSEVSLKDADLQGVKVPGLQAVVAALTYPSPDTHWIMADAARLEKGTYNKIALMQYSLAPLELEIKSVFAGVVQRMKRVAEVSSGELNHAFDEANSRIEDERKREQASS